MEFTHFNDEGRARMVDVSAKGQTLRTARAKATVYLDAGTYRMVAEGKMKKGDVLAVAQIAGITAAKRTFENIPLCHPVALTGADISFALDGERHTVDIFATAKCKGETGVEMEALSAAATAALTVYDMCKAVQRDIVIGGIMLLEKDGGESGRFVRET